MFNQAVWTTRNTLRGEEAGLVEPVAAVEEQLEETVVPKTKMKLQEQDQSTCEENADFAREFGHLEGGCGSVGGDQPGK